MKFTNPRTHFGPVSRFLHWSVFLLFCWQYLSANIMIHLGRDATAFGMTQGDHYNWHKSIGLVLLVLAIGRIAWRKVVPPPDWAPTLSAAERDMTHWYERLLYWGMFLLPISGYLFVMAGDYGIKLFGVYDLPNPIAKREWLAAAAQVTHIVLTYATLVVISWHVGLVIKHQLFDKDGLLRRMLPFVRP